MTCIVGTVNKGVVYIGGDSAGVAGLSITVRKDVKVFRNGPFLIGITTSFRMKDLLQYKLRVKEQMTDQTDEEYMATDFVDAVKKLFKDNSFGTDNSGGNFLVGYKGVLYNIENDFQVGIPALQYDAVGCGADLALGSMFSTVKQPPEQRIKLALEAAEKFSGGVRAPFVIEKQDVTKRKH